MLLRFIIIVLTIIALNGWCESIPQNGAFIFIEQKPSFTSEDKTAKSTAVYLNEKGLVQRYACEDYTIRELQEGSFPVARVNIFKTLSAISLKSLPGRQKADFSLPPSQAHPGHTRVVVRQSGGVDYQWAGASNAIPSPLQKLVQDSSALALKLSTPGSAVGFAEARAHTSGLAAKLNTAKPPACNPPVADSIAGRPAGAFVRANVLSADTLDEYRVNKLLKTVKTLDELDSVLQEALCNPFCLIPVPEGKKEKNLFPAFAIRGESNSLPLLYNETGYEVSRYSFTLPSNP